MTPVLFEKYKYLTASRKSVLVICCSCHDTKNCVDSEVCHFPFDGKRIGCVTGCVPLLVTERGTTSVTPMVGTKVARPYAVAFLNQSLYAELQVNALEASNRVRKTGEFVAATYTGIVTSFVSSLLITTRTNASDTPISASSKQQISIHTTTATRPQQNPLSHGPSEPKLAGSFAAAGARGLRGDRNSSSVYNPSEKHTAETPDSDP